MEIPEEISPNKKCLVDYKSFEAIERRRKPSLFIKRPEGATIPKEAEWRCICGWVNKLLDKFEQHCVQCGIRLGLQENYTPGAEHWTMIRVGHFAVNSNNNRKDDKPEPNKNQ